MWVCNEKVALLKRMDASGYDGTKLDAVDRMPLCASHE